MAITNGAMARAQETPLPPAQTSPPAKPAQAPKAKVTPAQPATPTPRPAPMPRVYATPRADEDSETHATPLTMKVARNARIAAVALQPIVAEIFAISRFDSVFEMFPTVRDALAAMSPDALAAYDASMAGQR